MKNSRSIDVEQLVGPSVADEAIAQLNEALVAGVISLECYSEMVDRLIGDKDCGDHDSDLSFLA